MNLVLLQIGGMIRYEALMQFRRRMLILIAAFFTTGMIILGSGMITTPSNGDILDVEIDGNQITTIYRQPNGELLYSHHMLPNDTEFPRWLADADIPMIHDTWHLLLTYMPGLILLAVAIPPLLTEIIPLDARFKMTELIWTKPLSKAAFLAGKVLSVWFGFAGVMAVAALILFVFARTQFRTLDAWLYIRYWIVLILPLTFVVSGYSVLLGGLTRSRRASLFIGLAVLPLALWTFMGSAAMTSMMNFLYPMPGTPAYESYEATAAGMLMSVLTGLMPYVLLLIAIWVGMWVILRLRDA